MDNNYNNPNASQSNSTADASSITIQELWQVFKKRWIIICIVTILCACLGFAVGRYIIKPNFTATATLIMSYEGHTTGNTTIADERNALAYAYSLGSTIDDFLDTKGLINIVNQKCNPENTELYNENIDGKFYNNAVAEPKTSGSPLVIITYTSKNAKQSVETVNCIADSLVALLNEKDSEGNFKFINYAGCIAVEGYSDSVSVSRKDFTYGIILALLGFIASYIIFLVAYFLDDTIKSKKEIQEITGFDVIAFIEDIGAVKNNKENK